MEEERWGIWRRQEWEIHAVWGERETGIGEQEEIGVGDGDEGRWKGTGWGQKMCMCTCLHLCERQRENVCMAGRWREVIG